jgi:hypothetical protein
MEVVAPDLGSRVGGDRAAGSSIEHTGRGSGRDEGYREDELGRMG